MDGAALDATGRGNCTGVGDFFSLGASSRGCDGTGDVGDEEGWFTVGLLLGTGPLGGNALNRGFGW